MSATQPNWQFGTGYLYASPNAGNLAANPTPVKFGVLQEVTLDVKGDIKKLFSQTQFAVAKARGKIDVTVKGKFATLDPTLLNQLYWGQAQTSGMTILAADESQTISAGSVVVSAFTDSPPLAAAIITDYGVWNGTTGIPFTKLVSGPPAQGEYTVNLATGTYTFNAADNGTQVFISYTYLDASRGTTTTLTSQAMGYAPEFRAFLFNQFQGNIIGVELYSCMMGSWNIPTKMEDFWVADFDMDASTNNAGVLGAMYQG
jgi:hypothetical protein